MTKHLLRQASSVALLAILVSSGSGLARGEISTRVPSTDIRAAALRPTGPSERVVTAGHDTLSSLPETPAGQRGGELLRVLESADTAAIRGFVEEGFAPSFRDMFPMERHLEILGQMARETGGLVPLEVRQSAETELTLLVQARETGERLVLNLRVEAETPHRVAGVGMRPQRPADDVPLGEPPAGEVTDEVVAREVKAYVDRLAEADAFSGVVLLARGDRPFLRQAWGQANKSYDVPNRPDTKFNLGSMNKMFTAVAIARLVEEDRIAYDEPVGKYLGREWIRPEVGEKVRIEHLLTHTGGLGSYFGEEFDRSSRARFRDLEDFQRLVRDDSLRFEPGTNWSYSNTGFLLLGAVIEAVSGQSYDESVRERILEPAGMHDTGAFAMDEPVPNLAYGYTPIRTPEGTRYRNNLFDHVIRGGPAGGGFSTAPDLLAFAHALRSGRLVSAETLERMTAPKPELGSPEYGYGFGFWEGGRFYGHTGGFPGISAMLMMERGDSAAPRAETGPDSAAGEEPLTVVALSNYSGGSDPVLRKVLQLLQAGR